MIIDTVLDHMTRKMDDMPYWFMGLGVAFALAVMFSGAVDW